MGVLDEMYHRQKPVPTITRPISPDAGMRDVRLGLREVRSIMRQYPDVKIVRDGSVQPGDVVILRSSNLTSAENRPGHAMIAGPVPWTAWHATRSRGVTQTSLAACRGLIRVYRPGKKGWWA